MKKILELNIPIRIISEANTGFSLRNPKMTWVRLKKRKDEQKNAIYGHWMNQRDIIPDPFPLPCSIKLTRIAPRSFDYDNLVFSFKHIKDYLCDLIKPGYRLGMADGKGDILFAYCQEKGMPKQYAIKIELFN